MITCKNCLNQFHVKPSRAAKRLCCSRKCQLEYFDRNYSTILQERFLSLTDKRNETTSPYVTTPCWIWLGNTDRYGYGYLTVMKPTKHKEPAHRVSMRLFKPEEIIDGLHTCHHCHTRLCVNPEHLHSGTAAENIAEMVAANRQSGPPRRTVETSGPGWESPCSHDRRS